MQKSRIALLGSVMLGLLCGAGVAQAQYYDRDYDPAYTQPVYDPVAGETVIVRPYYDRVYKQQRLGRINGEVNPTEYTISRPVDFSDLDLSRGIDRQELWLRVHQTSRDLCHELDVQVPGLRGDPSADRECVRTATRNAMRDVGYRY
jgi:UrcA family protein